MKEKEIENFFKKFVKPYLKDKTAKKTQKQKYKLKYQHTLRTANVARDLAKKLQWSKHDVNLAYLIGMLHDICRFDQIKETDSFRDSKDFEHGDIGHDLIKSHELIKSLVGKEDFDIILHAVKQHNKLRVDPRIKDKRTLNFCHLIRDADKLDILYTVLHSYEIKNFKEITKKDPKEKIISKTIMYNIHNHKITDNKHKKTKVDELCYLLGFMFDFHFKKSLEIFKEKKYLDKYLKYLKDNPNFEDIKNSYLKYLD